MAVQDLGLVGTQSIVWTVKQPGAGLTPLSVTVGTDPSHMALQVAVADWTGSGAPTREALKNLHVDRQAKKLFPLVVVAVSGPSSWVYGPAADADVIALPVEKAARVLQAALAEPTGLAARQRLGALHRAVGSGQEAGVVNRGLFAGHYLQTSVREREDWDAATTGATAMLTLRHEPLVKALGFSVLSAGQALLLNAGDAPRAIAVLLDAAEQFDAASKRFDVSPVAFGLRIAAKHEVPWLIVLRGTQIRLYPARPGVGVGQKGQVDTWFELDLAVIDHNQAGLLPLVFSAAALGPGGSTQELLDGSAQFAVELGERLRDRIYERVVPDLARAVAAKLSLLGMGPDAEGLDMAYRLTMRILFRLLFQAYAEDRGLLPYGRNSEFDSHSLNKWAKDLAHDSDVEFDPNSTSVWDDLVTVWRVVDSGDAGWDVPAYNGGLFGSDPALHPEGHLLTKVVLDNATMGVVLRGMLVDGIDGGGSGAVDFRSLSVREFGTIYEGLLESSLSVAPIPLTLDKTGTYVPVPKGGKPEVRKGEVYFHSASGQRKSTGTYYTPHIVVEHLLTRSLDPVLDEHLGQVRTLLDEHDQSGAAELFFDFRVADLAMGSAHFLTAAIDHIEARMRDFLTEFPIPSVADELRKLEQAAVAALGDDAAAVADIDPAALLRRQIARRCIYGLDINPMAVELARLAIWITTFVPGLPMSSLDHSLVCANSLTGVGTVGEAVLALDPAAEGGQLSTFTDAIESELAKAKVLLVDAANASEATKADVTAAAKTALAAREAAGPARVLFDAVVAGRLGLLDAEAYIDEESLMKAARRQEVVDHVDAVSPAHLPFLFPEVFLRDNPGFDVILGNPPWEKLHVEEHVWWGVRYPGLRAMSVKERDDALRSFRAQRPDLEREYEQEIRATDAMAALVSAGPFPGIGAAHLDLMAAFSWRFLHAVREGGGVGVVLPRTAFAGASLGAWRQRLLTSGTIVDLTMILNTGRWAFDMEARYTIGLLSFRPGESHRTVSLRGPFSSAKAFAVGMSADDAAVFDADDVAEWPGQAALPMLPDQSSLPIFAQMQRAPRLGDLGGPASFRPIQGDLNATADKSQFSTDVDRPPRGHTLAVWTGRTFNIWDAGSGDPYGWASPAALEKHLQTKRLTQVRNSKSAFFGMPPGWAKDRSTLPMHHARIAFRDVARATDSRTMICALIPPNVALVHKSPYLFQTSGARDDEAFLLGVLSSIPFDWYCRRYVEITMSFQLLNGFPVPWPDSRDPWRHRVVEISGRLAAVDERYREWADAVGVPVASVTNEAEKHDLIAELDAIVSLLYGLSASQLEHVFETFHVGWRYEDRLAAVLVHYRAWEGKGA